ncbi:MAG: STAS domain-containing protein [Oscillospiraceae bacterium]|jgi:anti-anti-sigma factor|nr:STAS domain-containing protein [Oscillospiraceae bacterium]
MNIEKSSADGVCLMTLRGRLDTNNAPKLLAELETEIERYKNVTLDFAEMEYVASAGLRALLAGEELARLAGGLLSVKNVSPEIMEIFDMTGFTEILNIL